jgi:hypothetical protein
VHRASPGTTDRTRPSQTLDPRRLGVLTVCGGVLTERSISIGSTFGLKLRRQVADEAELLIGSSNED